MGALRGGVADEVLCSGVVGFYGHWLIERRAWCKLVDWDVAFCKIGVGGLEFT